MNDTTTAEGTKIDPVTSSYGFSLIISDPTHIHPNSSSYIDLILTNQPNLVIKSGVDPVLHLHCHPQIPFAKLNLKTEYPALYERLIWDYRNANEELINRAIESLSPIILSHVMTKIHHGLMMKFEKSWIRKMNYLNSWSLIGDYKGIMIDCNASVVTW